MAKKLKLTLFIFGLIALATMANFVFAQDYGTNVVTNSINLSQGSDPRIIVTRVIQIALTFLGIIALFLIMYAGVLWMTSNGDEDKIDRAKQTLRSAVIGLAIILSSWAIATYVISRLTGAIGGEGSANIPANTQRTLSNQGVGAIGSCSVASFYPENNQTDVARNSSIIITFKEDLKINSVCIDASSNPCDCGSIVNGNICNKINPQTIRIFKTDLGDACVSGSCPSANANVTDVEANVSSDKKTITLTPLSYLGDSVKNIAYTVKLSNTLKKADDSSMFKSCGSDYFAWQFEVSNKIDLTPPQVVYGSIFPRPDNEGDLQNISAAAKAAQGLITVTSCPNIHQSAKINSVSQIGVSPAATVSPLNYQGTYTKLEVDVSSASKDKALLFDANNKNVLLGSADFDTNGKATFDGYFVITAKDRNGGNSWVVDITPEKLADTMTIGDSVYTFTNGPLGNNNIPIPGCQVANPTQAQILSQIATIYSVLSKDPLVSVGISGASISLTAKVAGTEGNSIDVSTTNTSALQIKALAGGANRQDLAKVNDKKDVPMNTAIQLNFSKSINPLKISGLASEVSNYIKVVNYDVSAKANNASCTNNSECKSYKCDGAVGAKVCVGDYIGGKFLVSNVYKTVEFVSDNECGINGCGEKIYCLPADSHLAVEMKAADLKTCGSDSDCLALTPYNTCSSTPLGYKTCQNSAGENYPSAAGTLNGIVDASLNSFDGARNGSADGPIDYYNDNYTPADSLNANKKDNYRFSFFVNSTINLAPPTIESIEPSQGTMGVNLADPIKITWNTLMMNSSLTTGSIQVNNGSTTVEHKLISLKSSAPSALGFWVTNDNIDTAPLDGEPDKTISWIKHTPFSESMSYDAQAGSGVKDIYQNCFKPSVGPKCSALDANPASETNPSCCFGNATSTLGADGNCK